MNRSQRMRMCGTFLAGLIAILTAAHGQEPAAEPSLRARQHPASTIGLAVGARIPEFQLIDHTGAPRDFHSIRGPNGAVLYFYRSADWCIYCRAQLVETGGARKAMRDQGYGVAGISYDAPGVLAEFAQAHDIEYPLLSDPESKFIREFQVLDASILPGSPGYGVPYHGSYVIDENGIVLAKFFDVEPALPHSLGTLVTRLFGSPLSTHARSVKHDHLTLGYYASRDFIAPGDTIELFVDIALNDSIHLYAPGEARYLPIEWQIAPQPGLTVEPAVFPAGKKFQVNGESAMVYSGAVRLSRKITLAPGHAIPRDAQGNLPIKGSLRFQSCDDQTCFTPTTIPLEWKLGLAPARETPLTE